MVLGTECCFCNMVEMAFVWMLVIFQGLKEIAFTYKSQIKKLALMVELFLYDLTSRRAQHNCYLENFRAYGLYPICSIRFQIDPGQFVNFFIHLSLTIVNLSLLFLGIFIRQCYTKQFFFFFSCYYILRSVLIEH